jgi:hypothetical protein
MRGPHANDMSATDPARRAPLLTASAKGRVVRWSARQTLRALVYHAIFEARLFRLHNPKSSRRSVSFLGAAVALLFVECYARAREVIARSEPRTNRLKDLISLAMQSCF